MNCSTEVSIAAAKLVVVVGDSRGRSSSSSI